MHTTSTNPTAPLTPAATAASRQEALEASDLFALADWTAQLTEFAADFLAVLPALRCTTCWGGTGTTAVPVAAEVRADLAEAIPALVMSAAFLESPYMPPSALFSDGMRWPARDELSDSAWRTLDTLIAGVARLRFLDWHEDLDHAFDFGSAADLTGDFPCNCRA